MGNIIDKYFPELTKEQQQQIAALEAAYKDWNEKINLISRKDISFFYERHVLHSLGIAMISTFPEGSKVLDVGTGGGFPGIPLAILYPDVHFHLIDSIAKKINVVNKVVEHLGLTNVTTEQTRAEDHKKKYDFVVSRAVARMISFYRWTHHTLNKGGQIIYLKGGDIKDEMKELGKTYKEFDLIDFFAEPFFETKKVVVVKV